MSVVYTVACTKCGFEVHFGMPIRDWFCLRCRASVRHKRSRQPTAQEAQDLSMALAGWISMLGSGTVYANPQAWESFPFKRAGQMQTCEVYASGSVHLASLHAERLIEGRT